MYSPDLQAFGAHLVLVEHLEHEARKVAGIALRKELLVDFLEALKPEQHIRTYVRKTKGCTASVSIPFGQSLTKPLYHCLISFSVTKNNQALKIPNAKIENQKMRKKKAKIEIFL